MIKYDFKNYNIDFNSKLKKRHDEVHMTTVNDYGPNPLIFDASEITSLNEYFRSTLWTGQYFQITLMTIQPGESIGDEVHHNVDQALIITEGNGRAIIGPTQATMNYEHQISRNYVIVIPAGFWHNIINSGNTPLRLMSIYAPPVHKSGTINQTKPKENNKKPY